MKQWNAPQLTSLTTEYTRGGGNSYVSDGSHVDMPDGTTELLTVPSSQLVGLPS